MLREIQRQLNASWKICSLTVNGLLFLVIEGYLLNSFLSSSITSRPLIQEGIDRRLITRERQRNYLMSLPCVYSRHGHQDKAVNPRARKEIDPRILSRALLLSVQSGIACLRHY